MQRPPRRALLLILALLAGCVGPRASSAAQDQTPGSSGVAPTATPRLVPGATARVTPAASAVSGPARPGAPPSRTPWPRVSPPAFTPVPAGRGAWSVQRGAFEFGSVIRQLTGGFSGATIDFGQADGFVQAVLRPGDNGHGSGLLLRAGANLENALFATLDAQHERVALFRLRAPDEDVLVADAPAALDPHKAYELRAGFFETSIRVWLDGVLVISQEDRVSTASTRHGVGAWQSSRRNEWSDFAYAPPGRWQTLTVLGDSISAGKVNWPVLVAAGYHGGLTVLKNHAVSGNSVMRDMQRQVAEATGDGADTIVIMLGTNDRSVDNYPEFGLWYASNVARLLADNRGARLYCLGILDREKDPENREALDAQIASHCPGGTYTSTSGWIDVARDTFDGLHPTAAAHREIAGRLLKLLAP